MTETTRLSHLKGEYAYLNRDGRAYARYQYEETDGGRIWFYVEPAPKGAGTKMASRVLLGQ
ncbi:hypothetical protein ACFWNH_30325 [Rhodococcus qingshengii]|uniref:hypothetical protein n=1 Tax=Rhodococcus qingshengii TaxID=334542 RepID=UPI003668231A